MRTVRFGRSRWQRWAGVVAFVAAGALVLASCSSGPTGVAAISAAAQARAKAAAARTIQFPSGPVAEHVYGPSWARFVAAFPGKVVVGVSDKVGSCAVGSRPQYSATVGTLLTGSDPAPPSYDVLIWRCGTVAKAEALFHVQQSAYKDAVSVLVGGHDGFGSTIIRAPYGAKGRSEWVGVLAARSGVVIYGLEGWAETHADIRAFLHSFRLDFAGFAPAK